jgi:hypothetical protein
VRHSRIQAKFHINVLLYKPGGVFQILITEDVETPNVDERWREVCQAGSPRWCGIVWYGGIRTARLVPQHSSLPSDIVSILLKCVRLD